MARVASRMRRLDFVERAVECFIDFNECVTKLDDIMRNGAHNNFAVSNMKRLEELNHIVLRFLLTDVENLPPGDASILARLRQRGFVQERPPLESVRRGLRERAKRLLQALLHDEEHTSSSIAWHPSHAPHGQGNVPPNAYQVRAREESSPRPNVFVIDSGANVTICTDIRAFICMDYGCKRDVVTASDEAISSGVGRIRLLVSTRYGEDYILERD